MVPNFRSLKHFISARRSFIQFSNRLRSCPEVSDKYKVVHQWVLSNSLKGAAVSQ